MAYDPLALAAYLRRARDPVSGFQPSFTNVDPEKGEDTSEVFDVRSSEEMLPLEDTTPSTINPVIDALQSHTPVEDYETTDAILAEIRRTEQEQDKLVQAKKLETEERYGVPQARQLVQNLLGQGLAESPITQRLIQDLQAKQAAANMSFGVDNDNGLVGTEAEEFRPFVDRLTVLDDRYKVVLAEEKRLQDLEDTRTRAGIQEDKELRGEDRALQNRLSALDITPDVRETIERVIYKGEKLTRDDIISMNDQELILLRDSVESNFNTDPSSIIMADSTNTDTYLKIVDASPHSMEEKRLMKEAAARYKQEARSIESLSEAAIQEEAKKNEQDKELLDNVEIRKDPKVREEIYTRTKQRLKAEAVDKVRGALSRELATAESMSLDRNFQANDGQKTIANNIIRALRDRFGPVTISDMASDADILKYLRESIANDVAFDLSPPEQAVRIGPVWSAMLNQTARNVSERGKMLGISVSAVANPDIIKLRRAIGYQIKITAP